MSVACQITNGKNAVNIYDKDFNSQLSYEVHLTDKDFCTPPVIVDVDSVFFCKDNAKLSFVLPCLDVGGYILEVIDKNTSSVIYTLNTIYY